MADDVVHNVTLAGSDAWFDVVKGERILLCALAPLFGTAPSPAMPELLSDSVVRYPNVVRLDANSVEECGLTVHTQTAA